MKNLNQTKKQQNFILLGANFITFFSFPSPAHSSYFFFWSKMLRNMSHSPMRLLSNLSKKKNLMVSLVKGQHNFPRSFRVTTSRNFCTTKEKGVEEKSGTEEKPDQEKKTEVAKFDPDEYDDYEEEPRTAGEHVAAWARLGLRLVFVLGLLGGVVFAGRELFPGRMGPNRCEQLSTFVVHAFDVVVTFPSVCIRKCLTLFESTTI